MKKKKGSWLNRSVLALSAAALLTDVSGEMVAPFLPIFITGVLGGGALAVGLVDGLAEAVSAVLKLQAGRWSDALGKRRPFVVFGYGLSSFVRPLMALATAPWHAIFVRISDRVGKGLRTSPRDAILAASVPVGSQGRAFGFHRAMDHVGAVLGPLAALGLLSIYGRDPENLRKVFLWGAIPGLLAVLVLWLALQEKETKPLRRRSKPWSLPEKKLWPFFIALGLFTLGASSDLFLLMKAAGSDNKAALGLVPWLWIGLHLVKAGSSLAGGWVTDHLGPKRTLALGWAFYALVYAGLALAQTQAQIITLILVYGLYYGLTEGPEKVMVSQLSTEARRAESFGWYHFITGLGMLPASLLFGLLYDQAGPRTAFLSGAGFALAGLALLYFAPRLPDKARA